MNFNFVDIIILFVLLYFFWQGYLVGLVGGLLNLLTTIISILSASIFYPNLAPVFQEQFGLEGNLSSILAFFTILIVLEIVLSLVATLVYKKTITPLHKRFPKLSRLDHLLGTIPAVAAGALLVTLFLLLFVLLPLNTVVYETTSKSWWGRNVVSAALKLEPTLEQHLNRLPYQNLIYLLTPSPSSEESVDLPIPKEIEFTIDENAEAQLLSLVNEERTSRGLRVLQSDSEQREVGRKHCLDMFERSYFSHYTPEGESPFDRMKQAGVRYMYAGENLAYAPTVAIAHKGLMDSPGHRENILRPEFGRLGIGVIDGGLSGKMFCQEFRD